MGCERLLLLLLAGVEGALVIVPALLLLDPSSGASSSFASVTSVTRLSLCDRRVQRAIGFAGDDGSMTEQVRRRLRQSSFAKHGVAHKAKARAGGLGDFATHGPCIIAEQLFRFRRLIFFFKNQYCQSPPPLLFPPPPPPPLPPPETGCLAS